MAVCCPCFPTKEGGHVPLDPTGKAYGQELRSLSTMMYRSAGDPFGAGLSTVPESGDSDDEGANKRARIGAPVTEKLQENLKHMSLAERERLLREDVLLLAPTIRETFRDLPDTRFTYVVPYADELDKSATNYLGSVQDDIKRKQGVIVFPLRTTGDGNCLLHAVSRGIWGVELFSDLLRDKVFQELFDNRQWYESMVEPGDVSEGLDAARHPRKYLSTLHIVALAHVLRRPVILYASLKDVSNYGCGYYGVAGLFAPTRLKEIEWHPRPVAVGWASQRHEHYVPLVWSASQKPPDWPFPDEACPDVGGSLDPFKVPSNLRAFITVQSKQAPVEQPLFVHKLVKQVRQQVVDLQGHLLARAIDPSISTPPKSFDDHPPESPPNLMDQDVAGPSTPAMAVAPPTRWSSFTVRKRQRSPQTSTSPPLTSERAQHNWKVAGAAVRSSVRIQRAALGIDVELPKGKTGVSRNWEWKMTRRDKQLRVVEGDDPFGRAGEIVDWHSGAKRAPKQKPPVKDPLRPPIFPPEDGSGRLLWVSVAEQITGKLRGAQVADAALRVLARPYSAEQYAAAAAQHPKLAALAATMVRLSSELKWLTKSPLAGIDARPVKDEDLFLWRATFAGPVGTPWEGGRFVLEIKLPEDYPNKPPSKVRFLTPLFHPNVDPIGTPCMDFLSVAQLASTASTRIPKPPEALSITSQKRERRRFGRPRNEVEDFGEDYPRRWTPYHGIAAILLSVQMLFFEAWPEQPLNAEAATMYIVDRRGWEEKAHMCAMQNVGANGSSSH